jgi:hypothetical protein
MSEMPAGGSRAQPLRDVARDLPSDLLGPWDMARPNWSLLQGTLFHPVRDKVLLIFTRPCRYLASATSLLHLLMSPSYHVALSRPSAQSSPASSSVALRTTTSVPPCRLAHESSFITLCLLRRPSTEYPFVFDEFSILRRRSRFLCPLHCPLVFIPLLLVECTKCDIIG